MNLLSVIVGVGAAFITQFFVEKAETTKKPSTEPEKIPAPEPQKEPENVSNSDS